MKQREKINFKQRSQREEGIVRIKRDRGDAECF